MNFDLTGIKNQNEYFTNHYFSTIFAENAGETITAWKNKGDSSETIKTPWSRFRENSRAFYAASERLKRNGAGTTKLDLIQELAESYLKALGYPEPAPENIEIEDNVFAPVYVEIKKPSGAPLLWAILAVNKDSEEDILNGNAFSCIEESSAEQLTQLTNQDLANKILYNLAEPPRFLLFVSGTQIALIDRNKWNEKRYLQFELDEIFARREESTFQALSVLLHKESLCPDDGKVLLDALDENSQKNASGVSQDLKYALRECIELLGNEVLYDMAQNKGRDLNADPVDAGQLTLECLRYMYRMLFVLFIESRPELGYAPIKSQSYYSAYSLESLRDIAEHVREDIQNVGEGTFLCETLSKLYDLIYSGYPEKEEDLLKYSKEQGLHDMFVVAPLKAHIFDPDYTAMVTAASIRNSVMLRIVDLMSVTRETGHKNARRGRISYANLGINQMGAVYEALLSYRGFIAEQDLYEVKRAGDSFNELDVGYFVPESDLSQYTEDERVRYERDDDMGHKKGELRMYRKGTFIYRLAGREREKSASYYTPECLTKCLVKYALKELLKDKSADDILGLTVCEPAMGSAAFLNEAINQLAEAYLDKKQKELGDSISYETRPQELQKVKMYIADRNVYGIDLNPVAVELAEVSLWLNTIYAGGYVPWFGTQLINGNSLIGARRQCYHKNALIATQKNAKWFENAPERVPLGEKRGTKTQVYHFLLGDPGMCSYDDKVIKKLEPENIKKMGDWNKKFNSPYTEDEVHTMLDLSAAIDELWDNQVKLRKTLEEETRDKLNIYGHEDQAEDSHTTIRLKDKIYKKLYKSEHAQNAGPYARLKFAMDYWCALWFWPIDKADMLPSRSEFLNEMNLILVGAISTAKGTWEKGQYSLFPTEKEQLIEKVLNFIPGQSEVNLDNLCALFPRLALVRDIAEQNRFMHWELEFADLFADRGGFDLVIGNPPWVKITWSEQGILSDKNPLFAVKNLTAPEVTKERDETLTHADVYDAYLVEYASVSGLLGFLNAFQNYPDLKDQQTNLFKCFLPQAWMFNEKGTNAFVHPEGVYDDPKGGALREKLYPRLRKHFQFQNELMLFADVGDRRTYSLNIYGPVQKVSFDTMANLFAVSTIDQSYTDGGNTELMGIKDHNDEWNIVGHPNRIIHVEQKDLLVFAQLFDGCDNWKQAKLPVIHAKELTEVLEQFALCPKTYESLKNNIYGTRMWDETGAQKDGFIAKKEHFPNDLINVVYSSPHIAVANPLFKTSRRSCVNKADYDSIDLTNVPENYMQRFKYQPACELSKYTAAIQETPWGAKYNEVYRLVTRSMLNQSGDRTLLGAIIPPKTSHILSLSGVCFKNPRDLAISATTFSSLPFDFYIKATGKSSMLFSAVEKMPYVENTDDSAIIRGLMLNCLNTNYTDLWKQCWRDDFATEKWSKSDPRLNNDKFSQASKEWNFNSTLRTDYERRQALVEIDVLVSMAMGMNLDQLKTIYRIQFPLLQEYEADTWYDVNGRIVYTVNRSLTNTGFSRTEWEKIKNAPAGEKFHRTITDDTMPGGPVERTIEYVAPFDRCNRETDYETAWNYFTQKYGTK
ncbi:MULTISPECIES: hypothetical protein [unclassified Fibrobacter]|uniref:Eco57I restriction-modification methylase domain-containing protein n=1 Tax=unclassified Fibrobacter TaxID=2634177 RepID=UPI0025C5EE35|nr:MULTISPECIES: hypothetical protein [unclassified Fibrobacter]